MKTKEFKITEVLVYEVLRKCTREDVLSLEQHIANEGYIAGKDYYITKVICDGKVIKTKAWKKHTWYKIKQIVSKIENNSCKNCLFFKKECFSINKNELCDKHSKK